MTYKEHIQHQKRSIERLNKELEKSNKTSLSHDEIIHHQNRNNEILHYNNSKYQAKNKFLTQFIVAYGILIIFGALIYGKLIPSFIGEPIAILYGTIVSLYLLGVYTDISIRSKRYFYKYNFMKHDNKNTSISESGIDEDLQCIGEECCPHGTTYNAEENLCVVDNDEKEESSVDIKETTNAFQWENLF